MSLLNYKVSDLREHFKTRFSEWLLGAALAIWGFIVIISPDLFSTSPTFINMSRIASQPVWGYTALGIGLLRIVLLFINGTWRRSAHLRALGSGASACVWAAIWGSYLSLDHLIPNLATIAALIATDVYSLWFAAEDAKIADRK